MTIRRPRGRQPARDDDQAPSSGDRPCGIGSPFTWQTLLSSWPHTLRALALGLPSLVLLFYGVAHLPTEVITALVGLLPY